MLIFDGKVRFVSSKLPAFGGQLMRMGTRYLAHWDRHGADAWLRFPVQTVGDILHLAKVDSYPDFSYGYEDLSLARDRARR